MISTLRDELTQRCDEIIELEAAISSLNQHVTITAESSIRDKLEVLFIYKLVCELNPRQRTLQPS